PAKGNEKGGVEGEVGYFRRNHLVPVPCVASGEEFNQRLLADCHADQARVPAGRTMNVGEAMALERPHLAALAQQGFGLEELSPARIDGKGCARIKGNWYSAPLPPGTRVEARIGPNHIQIEHQGRRVARHARCYLHGKQVLDLEHYLDVIERKPGALAGSTPLKQWREQGRWPEEFDRIWRSFEQRAGKAAGTRAMIELLQLGRARGQHRLRAAVHQALELGCTDPAAVRHLLESAGLGHAQSPGTLSLGGLARYERPLPSLAGYDALLAAEVAR
ncbi:MAG: Mu transposase domain-containing protein, partial [Terriglobales bacterium]